MTKKDYVAIAAALASSREFVEQLPIQTAHVRAGYLQGNFSAAMHLANMLARDNPRFNRDRFLAACAAKVKE